MITLVLALLALILAVVNGTGQGRAPLWIAVVLLALAVMVPNIASFGLR
jgi:hypothetical protein